MSRVGVAILGGGPAGLAAAYELTRLGHGVTLFERDPQVGGLARTESYKGCLFDLGGHRFFTQNDEIRGLWCVLMGKDFLRVPRLSRIYHDGRFFQYPLRPIETLLKLGPIEIALIIGTYLWAHALPSRPAESFEQWAVGRFGRRLFETFFKTYTEKLWGLPCREIAADWADQRIGRLSLGRAISNAVLGTKGVKSLIDEFDYPVRGPGMMWQRMQERIVAAGGRMELGSEAVRIVWARRRVRGVTIRRDRAIEEVRPDHVITSLPLAELIGRLDPKPPPAVVEAAAALRYRALVVVGLIVNRRPVFSDNWIYIQSSSVLVGRIQNYNNWSAALVPDPSKTCLGMEYFCSEGDELWRTSDRELIDRACRELAKLGLARREEVQDGTVVRESSAYPVYRLGFRGHMGVIREFLATFENLQTIGRSGMHRYNNMDHSMLTGLQAARNLAGAGHDLWQVNPDVPQAAPIRRGAAA
jgi:protoporphyrinogen oxidase